MQAIDSAVEAVNSFVEKSRKESEWYNDLFIFYLNVLRYSYIDLLYGETPRLLGRLILTSNAFSSIIRAQAFKSEAIHKHS